VKFILVNDNIRTYHKRKFIDSNSLNYASELFVIFSLTLKFKKELTMQNKIRLLNEQTINKIAAGEVIENPASVVKELVENSIDAGATSICIEIRQGGRQCIRISDDGCGMSADDALLSLERHATSKIIQVEDIEEVFTMGFRGEAIPSIASISKFTLMTNATENQANGTLLKVEAGELLFSSQAPCAKGTTVEIKDLFFNVPVRRKFQKSPTFDIQSIFKTTGLLALSHPSIHFHLISDEKCLIKTPLDLDSSFGKQLANRIETIIGKDFVKELSPVKFQHVPYELEGFIGLPSLHKPNRANQYLFINRRAVSSAMISAAIREGYGPMLPSQRYPAFILHLSLPGSLMDVNVHPQKKEVRLRQEHELKEHLIHAVQDSLQRRSSIQASSYSQIEEEYTRPFFSKPTDNQNMYEEKWEYQSNCPVENSHSDYPSYEAFVTENRIKQEELNLPVFAIKEPDPQVLFTFKGFVVVDALNLKLAHLVPAKSEGVCLLSQRNGYARLIYERLVKQTSYPFGVQSLLVPITLNFSAMETHVLKEHLDQLNSIGFSLREFGDHTFLIDAYPEFLDEKDLPDCLHQIIQDLLQMQESRKLQQIQEEQFAWIACKRSLPSDKRLSIHEAQLLIDRLFISESPFQCPRGNAIFAFLSSRELSKFFEK